MYIYIRHIRKIRWYVLISVADIYLLCHCRFALAKYAGIVERVENDQRKKILKKGGTGEMGGGTKVRGLEKCVCIRKPYRWHGCGDVTQLMKLMTKTNVAAVKDGGAPEAHQVERASGVVIPDVVTAAIWVRTAIYNVCGCVCVPVNTILAHQVSLKNKQYWRPFIYMTGYHRIKKCGTWLIFWVVWDNGKSLVENDLFGGWAID